MPLVEESTAKALEEISAALHHESLHPPLAQFITAFAACWQAWCRDAADEMAEDMLRFRFHCLSDAVRAKAPKSARLFGENWDAMFWPSALGIALWSQGLTASDAIKVLRPIIPPWLKTRFLTMDGVISFDSRGEPGEITGMPSVREFEAWLQWRRAISPKQPPGPQPGEEAAWATREEAVKDISFTYWQLQKEYNALGYRKPPSKEQVAKRLGMVPKTLKRHRERFGVPWPPPVL
jgi:hypothetical protein